MSTVDHSGISDRGRVRFQNEDFIAHRYPEDADLRARKGSLFVVADGVGGHGAGEVASKAAAEKLVESYYASPWRPERALRAAFGQANLHVFDLAIETKHLHMQTTMSALLIVGGHLHLAHVGDSRIYRVRGPSQAEQLTIDHSEVAELVRMNLLAPEMLRNHPRRSVITRSVGGEPVVKPMVRTEELVSGDIFVMCTDGVWEPLEEKDIASIAASYPPDEACRRLVELGLERQSTDNVSAQVVRVVNIEKDNEYSMANETWWQRLQAAFKRKPDTGGMTGSSLWN
jgi:serine/threonine protein phosphatase PrpC